MRRQGLSRVVPTIPRGAGNGGQGPGGHSRGTELVGDEDAQWQWQGVWAAHGDVVR